MTSINWLVYGEAPRGIINSQIIDLANQLEGDTRIPSKIWVLSPIRSYFSFRREYQGIESRVKIGILPMLPFQGRHFLWQLNFMAMQIITLSASSKKQIWIARGPKAGAMVRFMKKFNKSIHFIYQSRGSIYDEAQEFYYDSAGEKSIPEERKNLIASDQIFAVTTQLVERHQEVYAINIQEKTIICPTILLSKRLPNQQKHQEQNLPSNFRETHNFVFMSGGQGWQSDDLVIHFLRSYKLRTKKQIHLRYLGNEPNQEVQNSLAEIGQIKYGRVEPAQIIEEMREGHFGLLLRDGTQTNYVSSPTKFAEYCAAGLIPVIQGVPFYQDLLEYAKVPSITVDPNGIFQVSDGFDSKDFVQQQAEVKNFAASHLTEHSKYYREIANYLISLKSEEETNTNQS